ncbi:serine/threonine-protein kinase HipA [Duganella sp. 1411]|jgi:serine/threonine-protein kinase HipA|uniref:HipA domain-containing protein n=1 Tax=Duganella sp. 1411 TaxID=2806572 RepID=UPI001AE6D679|nr:HipA domain-containing protein [Duganella sp. 1411]MBP1207198.1 serine/threonine-protein kinase HipA [Duganella sp. 1411]
MSARQLEVMVNRDLVGWLREQNDLWQFEYAEQWRSSAAGFDLSPALARARASHADGASNRPVQWYFDNLLPEEALRITLAKDAQLNADDAFGLLAYFGSESAGSLVLRDPGAPDRASQHGVRPLPLAELNHRILNLAQAPLTRDAPKRMSLAGAQHKMLVILDGGELYEPLPATPSTQILKPNHPGGDYPASVMNEYFIMRLARRVGMNVPDVHRLYAPQPVYLIDRFDRIAPPASRAAVADKVDQVRRRHVIDTCQLLNKARNFKYSAAHLDTLVEAIGLCRAKVAARLQLYRWVAFNILIGNGDNHLKNISFTVDANGIDVAPAYDMLCTTVYDTRAFAAENAKWPHSELAFSLPGARTFGDVRREHVLAAAAGLGLARGTAARELDRLLGALPAAADKLMVEIEAEIRAQAERCPDPGAAGAHIAGELRLLRAIRHVVLNDMCAQLAPAGLG